jgi:subtilisin family serine protease
MAMFVQFSDGLLAGFFMRNFIKITGFIVALLTLNTALAEEDVQLIITKEDGSITIAPSSLRDGSVKRVPRVILESISIKESDVDARIAELSQQKGVVAVERDVIVYSLGTSGGPKIVYTKDNGVIRPTSMSSANDPAFSLQDYLNPLDQNNLVGTGIRNVWDKYEPQKRVRVAVGDGGFLTDGKFADVTPVASYSFVTQVKPAGSSGYDDPNDTSCEEDGHGIGVYGVIGATRNNGEGIAGIVDADMYMMQVLKCGNGRMSYAAQSLMWAAGGEVEGYPTLSEPVDVVNFSLGSLSACPTFFQRALDFAVSQGVTVVFGAGNSTVDVTKFSPANCTGGISVGALDWETGDKADFSNYGETLDISTQGIYVVSLSALDGGLGAWEGTSFAAPIVAGSVALVKSVAPSLSHDEILTIMEMTISDFDEVNAVECNTLGCGVGILNTEKMVELAVRFEVSGFAKVTSALAETDFCDSTPYLLADGVRSRLCAAYSVELDANVFSQTEEVVTYQFYQWPQGRDLDPLGDRLLYEGAETIFFLSDIDIALQAGLLRCVAGVCDTELVLPVNFDNTKRPIACDT